MNNIKTWQDRAQEEYGHAVAREYASEYMEGEITELRAALEAAHSEGRRSALEELAKSPTEGLRPPMTESQKTDAALSASRTLIKSLESQRDHFKKAHDDREKAYHEAVNTLASERQANTILTEELAKEKERAEKAEGGFDFHAHLARQAKFSAETFGPGMRTAGVCDHIRKELKEIEADPTDLAEWIDVVILALDGAWRCGGSPSQIIDGIVAKQTKNEGRKWPDWRTADPNKAIEHDRSADAQPSDNLQQASTAQVEPAKEIVRELVSWYERHGNLHDVSLLARAKALFLPQAASATDAGRPSDETILATARHIEAKRAEFETAFKVDLWAVYYWFDANGFKKPIIATPAQATPEGADLTALAKLIHDAGVMAPDISHYNVARAALAASQQAAEPVLWVESEPCARHLPLSEIINSVCHTVMYHHKKPMTDNPVWPLYDRAMPPQQAEPVHQWRKSGACNWYDGHPNIEDGGGPYETRTLFRAAPPQQVKP